MSNGWRAQLVLAVPAALLVGSAFAYVQRAYLYELLDSRPLPPVETIDFHSDAIGETYRLHVQLPPGYDDTNKDYPLLFALEGTAAVGLYRENIVPLVRRREAEEVIVVGIGYAGGRRAFIGNRFFDNRRIRDYTLGRSGPFNIEGNADAFLAFCTDQLIPFLDATYRTNTTGRCVAGYGVGAHFATYAALTRPDVFARCLAIQPSPQMNLPSPEVDDAPVQRDCRFFFTAAGERGSLATVALFDFADRLAADGYGQTSVMDAPAASQSPLSAIAPAVTEGLRFLYAS
jgi:hypothetical protein